MSEIKDILNENEETAGAINISEGVIEVLADKATREIDGVTDLATNFIDSVAEVFGKKSGAKGVDVELKDNKASITVHVIIKYGCRIPEIAWRIQESVKNTVESMTDIEVLKVNISVDGVKFAQEVEEELHGEEE